MVPSDLLWDICDRIVTLDMLATHFEFPAYATFPNLKTITFHRDVTAGTLQSLGQIFHKDRPLETLSLLEMSHSTIAGRLKDAGGLHFATLKTYPPRAEYWSGDVDYEIATLLELESIVAQRGGKLMPQTATRQSREGGRPSLDRRNSWLRKTFKDVRLKVLPNRSARPTASSRITTYLPPSGTATQHRRIVSDVANKSTPRPVTQPRRAIGSSGKTFLWSRGSGDITNLVGCILTKQLPFQTYLASYFVFVDFSLVIQYIYYYKPPPPSLDLSPASSPALTPTATLTPTGVIYSARNLTRPHSRTPLLSVSEVEAGYRTYEERAKSHPRSGSRRFSGLTAAYPPAGLLPSTEEVLGSTSNTLRLHKRSESKPSLSSLRLRIDRVGEKGKEREDAGLRRTGADYERMEDEDEISAMTESFYSDVSAPAAHGRRVSWSRAAGGHPSSLVGDLQQSPIEEGSGNATGEVTPTGGGGDADEIRRRSRSRGRPSTRSRAPLPLLIYNHTSPVTYGEGETSPAAQVGTSRGLDVGSERASKSGSRRRSASIVFLSVGIGAFFTVSRQSSSLPVPLDVVRPEGPMKGQVLEWQNVVEDAPRISNVHVEETVIHFPSPDTPHMDEEPIWASYRKERGRHEPPPLTPEQKRRLIGRISAWACTTLYLTSRLPQIWKNQLPLKYTRKSVQGLSLALFVFAFLGNTFYVASILSSPVIWEYPPDALPIVAKVDLSPLSASANNPIPSATPSSPINLFDSFSLHKHRHHLDSPDGRSTPPYQTPRARAFLRESLPYLLGSGGTLCFDVIIVTQGIIYGRREKMIEEEEDEDDEESEEGEGEREEASNGGSDGSDGSGREAVRLKHDELGGSTTPGNRKAATDSVVPGGDRNG
ncbi:hypothetical protein FRC17_004532 [Serendipita sp. 399]|nr:hypothetical protein FRC17_004532 [Serendipita sp. 399]